MNANKPHKGTIIGEKNFYPAHEVSQYGPNLGYLIIGRWQGHHQFGFTSGHTSLVVKEELCLDHDEGPGYDVYEVETLNSRYTVLIPLKGDFDD